MNNYKSKLTTNNVPKCFVYQENGFVLVAALMFLVILTIIGLSTSSTMQVEHMISRNERLAQKNFYGADAGTEVAIEVIEQNIACPKGFRVDGATNSSHIKGVEVMTSDLYANSSVPSSTELLKYPSDDTGYRDITYPPRVAGTSPDLHTNISVFQTKKPTDGQGRESNSGYEGNGRGDGTGGVHYLYDIHSKLYGFEGSEAIVRVGYRHLVGTAGDCVYGR
ncbi:MAG: pilus assembly PilX N-terminal domain-containing protein [Desulfobulbaceae bacterium]|nr:pilus assembly PilX N-terminal domain-containing protein [Desulfobulbaceae bacterium]